jgi:EmrB/QacA subfamily drug resistance transporter
LSRKETLEDSHVSSTPDISSENLVLLTVALGTMLAPLNSTMIAVAMPSIMSAFDVELSSAGWLVTAYLIGMASLQPVSGKLGDRLGRRRLILGALAYFGAASLGAALSGSLEWLLFFRIQQAVAGAVIVPNGVALVREIVPAERRASRFGLVSSAISLAAAGGPALGGIMIELGDWRAIFYVNLIFILPALLLGYKALPATKTHKSDQPFDVGGAIILLVTLIGGAWLLIQSRQAETAVDPMLGGIVVSIAAAAFLWREWRHPDPIVQLRFFRHRSFAAANSGIMFSNLAMYATLLTIPLIVADQTDWSPARTGLIMAALSATTVVCAPLGGHLADKWGRRWPTVGGLAIFTAGLLLLGFAEDGISALLLATSLGIAGVGLGLSWTGLQTAAVESVVPRQAGVASGIYSTSRYLGSIVGSSILASLFTAESSDYSQAFVLVAIAAIASVCVSFALQDRPEPA